MPVCEECGTSGTIAFPVKSQSCIEAELAEAVRLFSQTLCTRWHETKLGLLLVSKDPSHGLLHQALGAVPSQWYDGEPGRFGR